MRNLISICSIIICILILSSCNAPKKKNQIQKEEIKHVDVYYEPGRFGGWPANHGIWIWDNEILVGFGKGYYDSFLSQLNKKIPAIALAYDFQIKNKIPFEPHDMTMDYIVSPTKIIHCPSD